ncbi:hypothetical protein L198_06971 [Cryptococcus wingfieldii CBS 7118]|uniref:Uncharacterized protein n=1 Tax=Cryptococcus wingfieldii CBS 7118 TaxID=1295528 RepID=A0A1E3IJ56_9TREE|nr:hypothetical protein L198_06971 [Cryptococcus wingfieldii CBS 7118]ODN87741.1 hypothetical protein L198_06971 [Cryptococcus wingfieldii CBS 7118]
MSANPPILAVPHQKSSPETHIKRYLSSLEPYVNEHARAGVSTFEKALRGEPPPESEGAPTIEGKLNMFGEEGEELVTRAELLAKLSGSGVKPAQPVRRQPLKDVQTASFKLPLDSLVHKLDKGKTNGVEKKKAKGTKSKEDVFEESETESAQRRLQRKTRRREKAAITKPKPPTPPPAKKKRKSKPPSVDGSLEGSEESEEVDDRRKGRRRQAIPAFVKNYQAKNVQEAAKPVKKKQGFLNQGKASMPICLPSEKPRLATAQPFSEDAFLGSQGALRRSHDEDDTFGWKLPHKRPLSSLPSVDVDDAPARQTSRPRSTRSPVRAPSHTSLPSSSAQQHAPSAHNSYSRMPPPGVANSPSWHTEITEEQASFVRKESGRQAATPGPAQNVALSLDPVSPPHIPRVLTPPRPQPEEPSPGTLREVFGGKSFVWPKNRGMDMSFGQTAHDETPARYHQPSPAFPPHHVSTDPAPDVYRPHNTLPQSTTIPVFVHAPPFRSEDDMEYQPVWMHEESRDDIKIPRSGYEEYGEDEEYQQDRHYEHEFPTHRFTSTPMYDRQLSFAPYSSQNAPDQLAYPHHHHRMSYDHRDLPQPPIFHAPSAVRREPPQPAPPTVNNTLDRSFISTDSPLPKMYELPSPQPYCYPAVAARGYAMSRNLDEGRYVRSWSAGGRRDIEVVDERYQDARGGFDREDDDGHLEVTEGQWKSLWSGGAGLR